MPLATLAAAVLTLVSTAAAVHGYRDNRITALTGVGLSAVMLGMLFVPGMTDMTAAALILTLLLPFGVALIVSRRRRRIPPGGSHDRMVLAVTLADIQFMAIAMFLMSSHGATAPVAPASHMEGMPMGGMPSMGGTPTTAAAVAAVLATWAACVAALAVPLIRGKGRHGAWHAVCSGTMIAAMAVVAL